MNFTCKSISRDIMRSMVMSASDYFKCSSCNYTVLYRVRGNTAKCSQCGGTMYRV